MENKMMMENKWFQVTTVGEQIAKAREGQVTHWLADGILVHGGSTLLYAPPACAKSLIAMDLALAATENRLWMSAHGFEGPINTLYIDDDGNNDNELNARLLAFGAREDNPHLHFVLHQDFCLTDDVQRASLLEQCRDHGIKLVIMDSLTRLHKLSETNASDMKRVSRAIKEFTQAGLTVVVLHHATKSGGAYRGSSEIASSFDGVLRLEKVDDRTFLLHNEKARSVGKNGVWKGCRVVIGNDETGHLFLDGTASLRKEMPNSLGKETPTDVQPSLRADILGLLSAGEMNGTALKTALKMSSRDYPRFAKAVEWLLAEQIITSRKEGKATIYCRAAEAIGGNGDLADLLED